MNIKTILNYTIVPPIKVVTLLLAIVPMLWLVFACDEPRASNILCDIFEFKFE